LKDGAQDVEDIPEEPNNDEDEREAIGGRATEILNDLRGEDHDPACYRYGPISSSFSL